MAWHTYEQVNLMPTRKGSMEQAAPRARNQRDLERRRSLCLCWCRSREWWRLCRRLRSSRASLLRLRWRRFFLPLLSSCRWRLRLREGPVEREGERVRPSLLLLLRALLLRLLLRGPERCLLPLRLPVLILPPPPLL